KDSTNSSLRGFKLRHFARPDRCGRLDGAVADSGSNQQCRGKLRRLHLADVPASAARRVLSASGTPAAAWGNHLLPPPPNMHYSCSRRSEKTAALPYNGLVMVS